MADVNKKLNVRLKKVDRHGLGRTEGAVPEPPVAPSRAPLGRHEWVSGALETLADVGMAGLRIESLAKRFAVTKGSFYWHFKDRQDLISAVLKTWEEGRMRDIDKQSDARPGQECERLLQIIAIYGSNRNRKGIAIELAVRDWARRDGQASAIVEAVDRYRLESASRLFVANGFSESEAKSRSLLLYAYVFGQSLMAFDRHDPKIGELKRSIAEYIVAR